MTFKMKYSIGKDYLPKGTHRRGGTKIGKVGFIVLHDVGNDGQDTNKDGKKEGTSAKNNISYYRNTPTVYASAHTFVDEDSILECIPATTGTPEKAWHVLYDRPLDNKLFGDDANDIAIGVELCYFPDNKAKSLEAYKRYIWYVAYVCHKFGLNPSTKLIGHEELDPGRKTDPTNGLKHVGKTLKQCKADIVAEYNECLGKTSTSAKPSTSTASSTKKGEYKVKVIVSSLNIRKKADVKSEKVGEINDKGTYTIVSTTNGWGKLKSGKGYINVSTKYVKKV